MQFFSLLIGKTVFKLLRISGRSGSALPGLVVEKFNPRFLSSMLGQLDHGVIIISGTNGKTTTTKIVTALLEAQGLRVLTNKTGSNFVRGTVAAVINKATWTGKLPYDIAILEQDEAHAVHFVEHIKPRGVLVLNIMRDQMDRFGEIDTTARLLQKLVSSATEFVVLNANDQRVGKLHVQQGINPIWYGHAKSLKLSFLTDDELHHGADTSYSLASTIDTELLHFAKDSVTVRVKHETIEFKTPLAGTHNAINLTAAMAVMTAIKPEYSKASLIDAIASLEPAFGRGEVLTLKDGTKVTIQLVKNPGGFMQALGMLDLSSYGVVAIAINDNYADGRDVSWLWDVDFNRLENSESKVVTGGSRGYDMAVRLKYDGVKSSDVKLDLSEFVQIINANAAQEKPAIIYCTYTAMLKIRSIYKTYSDDVYGIKV